jgi:hypothetical protein
MLLEQNLLANLTSHARTHTRSPKWWNETGIQLGRESDNVFQKHRASLTLGNIENLRIENVEFGAIQSRRLFHINLQMRLKVFSQNENGKKVSEIPGTPSSYKEGSLFASSNEGMSWK